MCLKFYSKHVFYVKNIDVTKIDLYIFSPKIYDNDNQPIHNHNTHYFATILEQQFYNNCTTTITHLLEQ